MKKLTIKFPLTIGKTEYPAGSIIQLPEKKADWLCAQKIDGQPCAVLFTGNAPAANAPTKEV